MGIQPAKSFMLDPPFEPRATGFLQGDANLIGRKNAAAFGAEADGQRDECVEIGVFAEFFEELRVG
jgi:hypothetical protein